MQGMYVVKKAMVVCKNEVCKESKQLSLKLIIHFKLGGTECVFKSFT